MRLVKSPILTRGGGGGNASGGGRCGDAGGGGGGRCDGGGGGGGSDGGSSGGSDNERRREEAEAATEVRMRSVALRLAPWIGELQRRAAVHPDFAALLNETQLGCAS